VGNNETQATHDRKRTPAENCLCSLLSANIDSTLRGALGPAGAVGRRAGR